MKIQSDIKQLPKQITGRGEVKGFIFTRICMTDRGFLCEVTASGIKPHYEVFHRKINNRYHCESYPGSRSFGYWAFTYRAKEEAMKKLHSFSQII